MSEKQFTRVNRKQERIGENMRVKVKGYGTIYASKDTLNFLCAALARASELDGKNNYSDLSKIFANMSYDIHIALKRVGYYDRE